MPRSIPPLAALALCGAAALLFAQSLAAMPSAPRPGGSAQPSGDRGGAVLIRGIPYHGQIYTEDCETAALQMALAHEGIRVSQPALLKAERISLTPPVVDRRGNVLRWGNPNTAFVGHPDSSSLGASYGSASGYGTYAPNIARVAAQYGGTVLWSGTGLTRARLEAAVRQGHPVIAWVGDRDGRMRFAPLSYWTAWDATRVPYPTPSSGIYEHTVLVVGITTAGPYVDDPLDGARSGSNLNPVVGPGVVSWSSFLAGFATFHGMAVILR